MLSYRLMPSTTETDMPASDENSEDKAKPPVAPASEQAKKDWQEQEDFLEESLEETFPGSDPIAPGHPKHAKD